MGPHNAAAVTVLHNPRQLFNPVKLKWPTPTVRARRTTARYVRGGQQTYLCLLAAALPLCAVQPVGGSPAAACD